MVVVVHIVSGQGMVKPDCGCVWALLALFLWISNFWNSISCEHGRC